MTTRGIGRTARRKNQAHRDLSREDHLSRDEARTLCEIMDNIAWHGWVQRYPIEAQNQKVYRRFYEHRIRC